MHQTLNNRTFFNFVSEKPSTIRTRARSHLYESYISWAPAGLNTSADSSLFPGSRFRLLPIHSAKPGEKPRLLIRSTSHLHGSKVRFDLTVKRTASDRSYVLEIERVGRLLPGGDRLQQTRSSISQGRVLMICCLEGPDSSGADLLFKQGERVSECSAGRNAVRDSFHSALFFDWNRKYSDATVWWTLLSATQTPFL
jgi:hypothetical protein